MEFNCDVKLVTELLGLKPSSTSHYELRFGKKGSLSVNLKNNIWYTLNVDDLQNYTGLKLIDYVLYIQDEYNELIKPKIISPDLPNNHLKYAITWYSVALSILLYFLYFRKKQ